MSDEASPIQSITVPCIDYTPQFNLTKSIEKIENVITEKLIELRDLRTQGVFEGGILIAHGDFEYIIRDVFQMGSNPFSGQLVYINDEDIIDVLINYMSEKSNDGALLVNSDGQILGANVYLVVNNPMSEVPDNTGTRHLAASSFSKREDVYSTFVLSETKNVVSIFKEGKLVSTLICEEKPPKPKKRAVK